MVIRWLLGTPESWAVRWPMAPTKWLKGQNFQAHPSPSGKMREAGGWRITNEQWFNQSCLHKEASIKTQKNRVRRASGLATEQHTQRRHGSSALCPLIPCPSYLPSASLPLPDAWLIIAFRIHWQSSKSKDLMLSPSRQCQNWGKSQDHQLVSQNCLAWGNPPPLHILWPDMS